MKFSQRLGIKPAEKLVQVESIDEELRNSLWNALNGFYWDTFDKEKLIRGRRADSLRGSNLESLIRCLWIYYFKRATDTIPEYYYNDHRSGVYGTLKTYFFEADWYEVYDFIEFVAENGTEQARSEFIPACNFFLRRENAAYSFVNGCIVEISNQQEVDEVEQALKAAQPYYGTKKHLEQALILLRDKTNPDFRNSIKESISAVESLCKELVGEKKATLGSALKTLEAKGTLHPALKIAFSSLYGYTSDAGGIRHALLEESNLSKSDARFMLISCSAFINYVVANIEEE